MDTKTVGMAVSASAIGAALAYLGLTNYNDESGLLVTEEDKTLTQVENTVDNTLLSKTAAKAVVDKAAFSKAVASKVAASKDITSIVAASKVDEIILKKSEPIDVTEKINNHMKKEGDSEQNASITQTKEFENEEELKRDEDKIKGEVKNVIEKEAWGKFWKSEYEKVDKNGTIKSGINSDGFQ